MAEEAVATFIGPLNSFSINLRIENATQTEIRAFGISGRTAKFPITWETFVSATSNGYTPQSPLPCVWTIIMMRWASAGCL